MLKPGQDADVVARKARDELAAFHSGSMPAIGFLNPTTPQTLGDRLRGFRQGLKETGFVEGENVVGGVPLGGKSNGSTAGARSRTGSPTGQRDRGVDRCLSAGSQGGNHDDPQRIPGPPWEREKELLSSGLRLPLNVDGNPWLEAVALVRSVRLKARQLADERASTSAANLRTEPCDERSAMNVVTVASLIAAGLMRANAIGVLDLLRATIARFAP